MLFDHEYFFVTVACQGAAAVVKLPITQQHAIIHVILKKKSSLETAALGLFTNIWKFL